MPTATLQSQPVLMDVPAGEPQPSRSLGRFTPVLAMVSGVVVVALAAALLIGARGGMHQVAAPEPAVPAGPAPAESMAITLSARDVSIVNQVYEPGEDSGWHAHSGIHAVAVLSGALTVYDGECRAQTFEPGQPYVGGQEIHLVRNEGASPAVMAVTYLNPSTGSAPTRHMPAPAGCAAGRG